MNNYSSMVMQPTATSIGVNNSSGKQNGSVQVPVTISNVQTEAISGIVITVEFDHRVLSLTNVQRGSLTSSWDAPTFNPINGKISIAFGGRGTQIPIGASGSVLMLTFSVIGAPGTTSAMKISGVQLSDPSGNIGTASVINGTFSVTGVAIPTNIVGVLAVGMSIGLPIIGIAAFSGKQI